MNNNSSFDKIQKNNFINFSNNKINLDINKKEINNKKINNKEIDNEQIYNNINIIYNSNYFSTIKLTFD